MFWQEHGQNWGVDLKYADAPRLSRSMAIAREDLVLKHLWVAYPGDRAYSLAAKVSTLPLTRIGDGWSDARGPLPERQPKADCSAERS